MTARRLLLIDLLIVAVILHGSLYPYDFAAPPGGVGPVATLLAGWRELGHSYSDAVANILLYVPFGFFLALTVRRGGSGRIALVTAAGLVLCTAVEIAQYYEVERLASMSDVYFNTLGTFLGAVGAVWLGGLARRVSWNDIAAKPIPALLLIAMLGYHLYPYVPTINVTKYWHALRPLVIAPHIVPDDVLRYLALWLTTCCLIAAIIGFARLRFLVPLFVAAVFAAKVAIVSLIVTPAEVVGAAMALLVWLLIGRHGRALMLVTAAVLCASIVVGRLEPFTFLAAPRPFGWLPFRSFLGGSIAVNTMALLEKFFLYGSLIWLAAESLVTLWPATALVAAVLLITSVVETYLPGRSAEITDAVMAVMIGVIFAPFGRRGRPARRATRQSARQSKMRPVGPAQGT